MVRFQLTPAPAFFEELARSVYRRHENRLVRQERWGLPEGGLTSTLNRAEMANAERTQNRSLFWLEITVAAATRETCKQLAAAVQARRGENRLHRRWMIVRENLYRRRFATATPPLLPSPRSLVSAAEAAHLLELPSARMKGVPVRRIAIPRIPMPPEILRASPHTPVAAPPDERHPCAGDHRPARAGALVTATADAREEPALVRHRPLPYPLLPVLRASNGAGLIHPDDRKYGALLVGSQGSGKSAAMLRLYLGDLRDDDAAIVVLDPKSELSRLCLAAHAARLPQARLVP